MYTIHVDDQLLFSTLSEDQESVVLSPKLSLEVNKAGSLSFVLPPSNKMHGSLKKLKSIVTVEHDDEQIFRGRVLEIESDIYKQQDVYCEGEKSFLIDSVHAPYSYSGSVHDLFRKLIANHNSMVDTEKKFTVGEISAVSSSETTEVENEAYASTSNEVEDRLLNAYGGYFRTRTVGNTHYIDWVDQYSDVNSQPIEFSVNLLDLKDKVDAGDVFTVLIPLGATEMNEDGEYTDPLSIASVNNGLNYIQNDEAVALYGKIWRTKTWSHEEDPTKLLEKGREYLKTGVALKTITLKAIDMHFVDGNVQPIRIGDRVRIVSNPHGLDITLICSKVEIDPLNPENTLYTFGEKPRTLSENFVNTQEEVGSMGGGGGRPSVKDELNDIIRWAKINVDEANALIELTAGELNLTNQRLSEAEIVIDGLNAKIELHAGVIDELEGSISSAEIAIDGLNAEIDLKVNKDGVISAINLSPESITIQASRINLVGYVTVSTFNAEMAAVQNLFSGTATASGLNVSGTIMTTNLDVASNLKIFGSYTGWDTVTLYKGGHVGISSTTSGTVYDYSGNPIGYVNGIPSGFNFSPYSDGEINYLSKA